MKKHDDYPALRFTCQGGPLHGEEFAFRKAPYMRGGTTPNIAEVVRDGIRISTFRRVAGERVPIAGRYAITFDEQVEAYRAVHEPSEMDVYYQAPAHGAPVIGGGQVPPAPQTFGMPILVVIPQPVSTLDLTHGQG